MIAAFDHPLVPRAALPAAVRTFREHLTQADAVVSGGALMPSLPALHQARDAVFRRLNRLGKPLILSGQSLYPFEDRPAPYRLATRIVLRDDSFSRRHALAAGMRPEQIVDGVDPAFDLAPAPPAAVERALKDLGLTPDDRFLAVSLRSGRIDLEAVVAAARSALRANMADCLLLVGMQRYWRERDDDALHAFARCAGGLPLRSAPAWSAPVLKGVLARARAVIACRYHAAVFALTSGAPSVSLAVSPEYRWKLQGIYHQFEREEWLTTPERLECELLGVLREREALSAELCVRREELLPRTSCLVDSVSEVLNGVEHAG
jgi:polysaccharide pyruvyl transferase WcaK-like protein